jgi:hypothetical protein
MLPSLVCRRHPSASVLLRALLVASSLLPASAAADFLRVPDDYASISIALGSAVAGDVIGVRGGLYADVIQLRNGITILGGYDPTFTQRDPSLYLTTLRAFDGGQILTAATDVGAKTVFDGFILTGGDGDDGGLARIQNASPTISHCRFADADGGRGGSLYLVNSESLLFENEFIGGSSSEVGGALAIFSSNGPIVRGCRFEENVAASSGGAVFINQSIARIVSCTFIANQTAFHGGAILVQLSDATIDSCLMVRCDADLGGGIGVFDSDNTIIEQSTIVRNEGQRGGGVYVDVGEVEIERSIVAENTGNGLEANAGAVVIDGCNDVWQNLSENYVNVTMGSGSFSLDPAFCDADDDDWRIASHSPCAPDNSPVCGLIGALPVGCGGGLIRVPNDYPSILLAINAAGAGDTVAVAEGLYTEHVTMKPVVRLLGGWRSDFAVRDPLLHPTVIDARGLMSAIVVQSGEDQSTIIDGFVIRNGDRPNGAGGGIYCFNASPTISNNVFHGNKANQGAAIGCLAGAAPTIFGNLIVENLSTGSPGGAIYVQANAVIVGNTLDRNEGEISSGITARFGGRPVISRNIVVNGRGGFGLFADKGAVPVTSCNDVWMNELGDYFGVLPGENSLSEDPRFCPGADRFLQEDSPCAPDNAPLACGLIGARSTGCPPVAAVDGESAPTKPLVSWLGAPHPHPVRFATVGAEIPYALDRSGGQVELTIFDAAGRCVRRLAMGVAAAGEHRASWDGHDERGAEAAPGVYFYRLAAGGREIGHRKLVIVR